MELVKSISYGSGKKQKIACFVAGYKGHIKDHQKEIHALLTRGYDIVAYEYDRSILSTGDPQVLIDIVEYITADFTKKAKPYKTALCSGISLGSYISFNVQKRLKKAKLGIYAGGGISVSYAIFHAKPFWRLRRRFEANGYSEKKLHTKWKEYELSDKSGLDAEQALVIVLGKQDRIVHYKAAVKSIESWQKSGTRITHLAKPGRGHIGAILWYRKNVPVLLEHAARL